MVIVMPTLTHGQHAHLTAVLLPEQGHGAFVDLSIGDVQPNVSRVLDDESRVPARCLVRGHRYAVIVAADSGALPLADEIVTWNGEEELTIGPLRLGGNAEHAGTE